MMIARPFARLALAVGLIALAVLVRPGPSEKAEAQGLSVSVEFREALGPHGRWQRHAQWGEVWVPARMDRDWRPYTRGHWVYTDDWGWYWVSDEEWGWVAYHYGRWVLDPQIGWVWIPGNEWGPAWVSWRRGGEEVGWAPLPPDDYVDRIDNDPNFWIFVRSRDVIAPSIVRVVLPRPRVTVLVRETVIVNRTVYVNGARVAANAGVPPSYIAARIGRPIQVSRVRPAVVRGTVGVSGAVEIDPRDKRGKQRTKAEVQNESRSIQPAKEVPQPKRFERGQSDDTPDAPKVLKQAQPDQQKTEPQQKRDDNDAKKQKQEEKKDAPPVTKEEKGDDARNAKQKRDGDNDMPKAKQPPQKQQRDDDAPKAKQPPQKQQRDDSDAQKAKQPPQKQQRDDDAPKAKQPPQKRDDQPKQLPQKQDAAPKAPPQEQRPPQPKQDAAPKAPPQQPQSAPQPKAPPQERGPSPERKKDD